MNYFARRASLAPLLLANRIKTKSKTSVMTSSSCFGFPIKVKADVVTLRRFMKSYKNSQKILGIVSISTDLSFLQIRPKYLVGGDGFHLRKRELRCEIPQ